MNNLDKKLIERISEMNLLTAKEIERVKSLSRKEKKPVADILVERDLMSDENVGKMIADILGIRFVKVIEEKISEDILRIIPEIVARKQFIIAFKKDKEGIKVAMNDPKNLEMIEFIQKKTGEKVVPYFTTKREIKEALNLYKKEIEEEFKEIIKKSIKEAEVSEEKAREIPIVKIVDTLLEYGYQNKASDIHIEPREDKIEVRFRIDGVLHDVVDLPKFVLDPVVTRIKILARLRTDEHRAAQDGKIHKKLSGEDIDIRVSIMPITDGEKVVMRILSVRGRGFSLEDLGLLEKDVKTVETNFKKPFGMILATGPTGSGKTTTLYAILKKLNTRRVNISTIEDPIEYDMEGINQIQVDPRTNLTFAEGLKSIMRQDPDIIMVGEIRDDETASIAVNAAMTGHLVLSSLHTNDAATTLPRLLDMGIEPYLVASTVNVAIAQRLVRKICMRCIESYTVKGKELEKIKQRIDLNKIMGKEVKEIRCYKGKGCQTCHQSGYSGRVGIFEVLEMEDSIRDLIMQKANSDQIKEQAVKNGMTTMIEDGVNKALMGITTIDEILRVIQ